MVSPFILIGFAFTVISDNVFVSSSNVICSGATKEDIEYELLDLQFLGIENLMLLRGDKAREDRFFTPTEGGHSHTTELIEQVNSFNEGVFIDGSTMKHPGRPFVYL